MHMKRDRPQMRTMVDQHIFFHPDYTVGSGISPDLLTLHECRRSRAFTAGGELHPALKTYGFLPRL